MVYVNNLNGTHDVCVFGQYAYSETNKKRIDTSAHQNVLMCVIEVNMRSISRINSYMCILILLSLSHVMVVMVL